MFTRKTIITITISIFIVACSLLPTFEKVSVPVKLDIVTDAKLNMSNNIANPVGIRIYQLTSDKTFSSAEFLDLFSSDTDLLAKDMLKKTRLYPVLPKSKLVEKMDILPDTKYLAVLIELTDYKKAEHKAIMALPDDLDKHNEFQLIFLEKTAKLSEVKEFGIISAITDWWKKLF